VPVKDVFKVSWKDGVKEVLREMHKNEYSHAPIVDDNGIVEGVLGEDSLVHRAIDEELGIDDATTISELRSYCGVSSTGQRSESVRFVDKKSTLGEVTKLFESALSERLRLSLVLLTENGLPTGKLTGLVTVWDLAAGFPSR
jgi:CBS domain-containing protein